MSTWNEDWATLIEEMNAKLNALMDENVELTDPGEIPITSELFLGQHSLSDMYFTAVTNGWVRLGRGIYWDIDESGQVNFQKGTVQWTPFSSNRFGIPMGRISVYENPATGGLLDADNKSSVYDVAKAIIGKIPKWQSILVDGLLDGLDDVEGSGYNDPTTYPLSYWSMHEETAWESLQRLAQDHEATMRVHTHQNGTTTILFEKRKALVDFAYDSPGDREYTISTRSDDPNWMKHLMSSKIERDIETMYSKFRVTGNQTTELGEIYYSLGLPVGNPQPIVFELNIPENEEKLGFERIKEFKSTHINTHAEALIVANAARTLYANDTYSGTVELAGCRLLYEHDTLGIMFDMNAILRLIDSGSVSGAATSGTENVFRVTGIQYSSSEHKTDVKLSTSVLDREVVEAQRIIDNLNKKTSVDSVHISRLGKEFWGDSLILDELFVDGTLELALGNTEGGGGNYSDSVSASFLLDHGMSKQAGDTGHVIAVFQPGYAAIATDTSPWLNAKVTFETPLSQSTGIEESPLEIKFDKIYKYSADTLTIIIPVTLKDWS